MIKDLEKERKEGRRREERRERGAIIYLSNGFLLMSKISTKKILLEKFT